MDDLYPHTCNGTDPDPVSQCLGCAVEYGMNLTRCKCITYATPSGTGDGYGGNYRVTSDCPIHGDGDEEDDEPDNSYEVERQERAWGTYMYGN